MQLMQLLGQDYAEIVAALKALTDAKGHERRTTARMEVLAQVKLFPFKDGKAADPYTCLTRDLSFKGVGLFQSKHAPRGSQFVVMLPRQENEPLSVLCTVMYSRPMADELYNVGAAFNCVYDFNAKPAVQFRGSAPAGGHAAMTPEEELKRIRQSILD
jgi:hypothetical protein